MSKTTTAQQTFTDPPAASDTRRSEYVVVARRYRPQTFEELIGQEHVARALSNAIAAERVGHAYLFTGARGVGKTSAARILAKALNCVQGTTPTPCNQCDICQSIAAGSDVDVLEIDGASNRGIDEIRQLRQNVNIRPSRARFKIYIIDEVHMLTREAFNALLKTLEEPPEHVKFIFCTTEPTKIPITILSRCQRFDFASIRPVSIVEHLEKIAAAEGVEAERAALEILARRANGSMRDGQSLLEQLLSSGQKRITRAEVHALLGTAAETRILRLAGFLVEGNAAAALAEFDGALAEGVDVGQLLEQLLGYFRDCMAAAAGCGADQFLFASDEAQTAVADAAKRLGLETILAMIQVIDQTLARLRYSTQARTLAEMAIVRVCSLKDLEELPQLIAQLRGGAPAPDGAHVASIGSPASGTGSAGAKKKSEPVVDERRGAIGGDSGPLGQPLSERLPPREESRLPVQLPPSEPAPADAPAPAIWKQALARLSDLLAENASFCEQLAAEADRLVVRFRPKYNSCKLYCQRPEQLARLESALSEVAGRTMRVEFALLEDEPASMSPPDAPVERVSPRQRLARASEHPLVRRAGELFKAHPIHLEEPQS